LSAYIVYNYNILDRSRIDELTQLSLPIIQKYKAEVIVGSPVKTLEGNTFSGMVIYKFESFEAAERFYYSKEQQELSELRKEITEGFVTIVPGDSETQKLVDSGYFESKS